MLPVELPGRWQSAVLALATRDDELLTSLGKVYVHVLRDDVVRRSVDYLNGVDGGSEWAESLAALEGTLRVPNHDLTPDEAGDAAHVLVGIAFFIAETFNDETDGRWPQT